MNTGVQIFDSTYRDGRQQGGMDVSLSNALKNLILMDQCGTHIAELGFPVGDEFAKSLIAEAAKIKFKQMKVAAFGRTRKGSESVNDSADLRSIVSSGASVGVLVCKSRPLDVVEALKVSLQTNLDMVNDSIRHLIANGLEVVLDLELATDAYFGRGGFGQKLDDAAAKESRAYFFKVVEVGLAAGARTLVVCDTTGGSCPEEVYRIFTELVSLYPMARFGFHGHDDNGLAVANSRAAVMAGARQIQGTINGYGERCGNANLCTIIPRLQLKDGFELVSPESLACITELSYKTALGFNREPSDRAPFVGTNAFKTFAGMHASGENRTDGCYLQVDPFLVGNERLFGLNAQSGASNVIVLAKRLELELTAQQANRLLSEYALMVSGGGFAASEVSFWMACRRILGDHQDYLRVEDFSTQTGKINGKPFGKAEVQVFVGDHYEHTISKGEGPVGALYAALKKAVAPYYPDLSRMHLCSYDLHAIDVAAEEARAAVRVEAEFSLDDWRINTAGVSSDSTHAALLAWLDAVQWFLQKTGNGNLHAH